MSYPGDPYQQPGQYPPRPPRSPWSSPIVLVAVAAGVLLVVAGVLAAIILIPKSSSDQAAPTTPTTVITSGHTTYTSTVTQPPATTYPTPTTPTPETTHDTPTVPSTDWQGFTDGPRCNAAKDAAVAIGMTDRSRVVICQVGSTSSLYYKGLADGNSIEIDYPIRSGSTFTATNKGYSYIVSPSSLTIAQGGSVLKSEPMIAFWSN